MESGGSLSNKPYWFALWIVLLEAIVVLVLIPSTWMDSVIQKEEALLINRMGEDQTKWIKDKSRDWYDATLVNNGLYNRVYNHMIPDETRKNKAKGWNNFGKGWFHWIDGRLKAFAKIYYHFLSRTTVLLIWLPFFLIMLVPAFIDGYCTWKVKREGFSYTSPLMHRISISGISLLFVSQVAIFIAPVPIDPIVMPIAGIIFCLLLGLMIGNTQKRI